MPAASSSPSRPSSISSRQACGSTLMPTPSGFSSATLSKMRQGTPIWWRLSASVSPPIPPPAIRTVIIDVPCQSGSRWAIGKAGLRCTLKFHKGPIDQTTHRPTTSSEDVMSKPAREFFSPQTLPPPVGYSQIAKINKGALVYIAGQVASDTSGKLVGEGNFEAQVEQVFRNLKTAVEAAGGT